MSVEARLKALGIELPHPAAPVANYVPWHIQGGLVYVSGQLPLKDGKPAFVGRIGETLSLDDGREAARLCAINLIAQVRVACDGALDRVRQVVRLAGFVNAAPEVTQHPVVLNGASDLMSEVFGERGRHVRVAVGVSSLPLGVAVEIEGLFAIEGSS